MKVSQPKPTAVDVSRLRKEYDAISFEVQTISKMIELNNEQYLRREDDLSREIKRLSQDMSQPQPKTELTDEEKKKLRRAQELSREIQNTQEEISAKRSDEELAGIAVSRLTQHTARNEDRARQICDCISEPLQRAVASLDESIASRRQLRSFLKLEGDVSFSPPQLTEKSGLQKQLAPNSVDLDVKSKQYAWFVSHIGESLREEGELRAERFSSLERAHEKANEQLRVQAIVLTEAQAALATLQNELHGLHQKITAEEERIHRAKAQGEIKISSEPSMQGMLLELEKEVQEIEEESEQLESDLTREKQRLARIEGEKADLLDAEQKQLAALDHSTSLLELCKRNKADAESTRTSLTKSIQQLDIARSGADRELQKLRSSVLLAEEDQSVSLAKVREMEDQQEKLSVAHRQAQRDAETKRSYLSVKEARAESILKEKKRLEEKLNSIKEERATARQGTIQVKSILSGLQQQEANAVRELQYLHSLLPKGHPSAKLSRLLEERRVADGLSPENLRDIALTKKPLLVAQAKALLLPSEAAQPPEPDRKITSNSESLKGEILSRLRKSTPVASRSNTPSVDEEAQNMLRSNFEHIDFGMPQAADPSARDFRTRADGAETTHVETLADSRSTSISEINQKLQKILSKRQAQ